MSDTDTTLASAQLIAVAHLETSDRNARRTAAERGLEELKASILAHGLMQNLVVTPAADGIYRVIAGGRRLMALRSLLEEGRLPADHRVLCQIATDEQAAELSLAENTVRLAMHPADEFEAFADLIEGGASKEDIAARFGTTVRHVEQRLKLGRTAPALRAHYRAGELTLDCLMAYAVTDDHARQLQVFASLSGWQKDDARHIRRLLTESMVTGDSKLAVFVGLDTYRAAGGRVRADLFGDDVYLENPELLGALAEEKLRLLERELEAEGWGWVEVAPEWDWAATAGCSRIRPSHVDAPKELLELKARLESELFEIEQAIEDTESDDLVDAQEDAQRRLAEIEGQLEAQAAFDPEEKRLAGCYAAIDPRGELCIERGLVRRAQAVRTGDSAEPARRKGGLPDSLRRDLEKYRLEVARVAIAENPDIAFDLLAFHAACRVFDRLAPQSGLDVQFHAGLGRPLAGDESPAGRRLESIRLPLEWLKQDGEEKRFRVFRELPRDDKLAILACCTALTLKPSLAPLSDDEEATAYEFALSLTGVGVAEYWRPTRDNYLGRITRDQLLAVGRNTLGDQWADARTKDKKAVLVEQLDLAFADPGHGARSPSQVQRLRCWLPCGMAFGTGAPADAAPILTPAA